MSEPVAQTGSSAPASVGPGEAAHVRSQRGPQTVINPERRAAAPSSLPGLPSAAGSSVKSSVVRVLFPPEDEVAAQSFDAQSGVQLGHFAIIERIRTGGMGAVFKALDLRLSRVVALKVLPPSLSRDPMIVQRFKNEGQAAAQLDHENVARVYFIGEEHGLHYIAFEYINGTNVRDLISQQSRLPVSEAVNYVLQIGGALVHTSAQGVVHRDIKPSNIIITPSGRAKLVDLGLARNENKEDHAADLTVAGTTLGTFDYISPEQARDPRTADVRSDIYSLGCTLYHMLTGEAPYPEGTVLQKLLQHQGDEAPDPSLKNRLVPENLSVVVRKMMAKDPRRRYQNPEQLVRDLMLVAGAMGLRSVSPEGLVWLASQPERTTFWERHLAWMVTAALLLAIAGYLQFGGRLDTGGPIVARDRESISGNSTANESSLATNNRAVKTSERAAPNRDQRPGDFDDERQAHLVGGSARDEEAPQEGDAGLSERDRRNRSIAGAQMAESDRDDDSDDNPYAAIAPFPLTSAKRVSSGDDDSSPHFELSTPGPGQQALKAAVTSIVRGGSSPERLAIRGGSGDSDASPRDDSPHKSLVERTDEKQSPAAAPADDDVFVVLGRDASERAFKSLEAACASVRSDGAVIELRYNGRRREAGMRVTRKITIRAAKGYRPVVEFHPTEIASDGFQVRAVWIPTGSLDLVGVDVVLSADETVSADQWSLFSLERADSLRMQGVTATLFNPQRRAVAAIELRPVAGAGMPDMPIPGAQVKPPLEIEIADSLIRGEGDLFVVRNAEAARLAVRQSLVALQGSLLSARGNSEISHENAQIELRLDHVTCVLGGGLIRLDSGNLPRKLLPVQVSASNSIFSNSGAGAPLIGMTGNSPPQDFHSLLFWLGQNNFYDRYSTFWSIASTDDMARLESWDAAAWRKNWADESNPTFDPVVWSKRPSPTRPFSEWSAAEFALNRQAANNPAVKGAANFTDAGADLAALPKLGSGGADDSTSDRNRD